MFYQLNTLETYSGQNFHCMAADSIELGGTVRSLTTPHMLFLKRRMREVRSGVQLVANYKLFKSALEILCRPFRNVWLLHCAGI